MARNKWKKEQKAKAAEGGGDADASQAAAGSEDGFRKLSKEEEEAMSIPERLQYQLKFNAWKKEQKAKAAASAQADKPAAAEDQPDGFKILSKEELEAMSMPDKLQYQMTLNK